MDIKGRKQRNTYGAQNIGQPKKPKTKEEILASVRERTGRFCARKEAAQRKESARTGAAPGHNLGGRDTDKTN